MAIFNSIVIGSAKGKIGNVVLTKLKGQNVAKSRNYSPANPRTPSQVVSRNRMKNAVLAWKFLAGFFVYWLGVAKQKESIYNAFVSAAKNRFKSLAAVSPQESAGQLSGSTLQGSAPFSVNSVDVSAASSNIVLNTNGMTKPTDLKVRFLLYSPSTGLNQIIDRAVTDLEWAFGELSIAVDSVDFSAFGVYLYSVVDKLSTSAVFNDF